MPIGVSEARTVRPTLGKQVILGQSRGVVYKLLMLLVIYLGTLLVMAWGMNQKRPTPLSGYASSSRLQKRDLVTALSLFVIFLAAAGPASKVIGSDPSARPTLTATSADLLGERRPATPLLATALVGDEPLEWWRDLPAGVDRERLVEDVVEVYRQRDFRPAWVGSTSVQKRARALLESLAEAPALGLAPERYGTTRLAREVKRLELKPAALPIDLVSLELRLTGGLVLMARDLEEGKVDAEEIPNWYVEQSSADVVPEVVRILEDGEATRLEPEHEGYRRLALAALDLRERIAAGGWARVPGSKKLEPGDLVPEAMLAPLVARLRAGGDLGSEFQPSDRRYGATLVAAVESFQGRHGLDVDGKVGPDTLAAMNVSAAERLRQIEANLERWRWLPTVLPEDRIDVDVASFELRAFRNGRERLRMDVAVGKPSWATPVLHDEIVYAEVNPFWNVPESIAIDEVIPELRRNPNHLAEENMEVVAGWRAEEPGRVIEVDWSQPGEYYADYRIRQRPGDGNALGRIKFIFPNEHDVYLHDTPAQGAFAKADRAVSHGCVRVSDPMALAAFLYGREQLFELRESLASLEPHRVDLPRPMPVLFHYHTAFVDAGRAAELPPRSLRSRRGDPGAPGRAGEARRAVRRLPAGAKPPGIDMNKGAPVRSRAVDPQAADERLVPDIVEAFFDDPGQQLRIGAGDSAVTVEVVHAPVAVAVDVDIGGVTVDMAAVAGLVADHLVVVRSAEAGEHRQGVGLDAVVVELLEQQLELQQQARVDDGEMRKAPFLLAEELAQLEVGREPEVAQSRGDSQQAPGPVVLGVAAQWQALVATEAITREDVLALVGLEHQHLQLDDLAGPRIGHEDRGDARYVRPPSPLVGIQPLQVATGGTGMETATALPEDRLDLDLLPWQNRDRHQAIGDHLVLDLQREADGLSLVGSVQARQLEAGDGVGATGLQRSGCLRGIGRPIRPALAREGHPLARRRFPGSLSPQSHSRGREQEERGEKGKGFSVHEFSSGKGWWVRSDRRQAGNEVDKVLNLEPQFNSRGPYRPDPASGDTGRPPSMER